jgi:hypothetical protein
MTGLRGRVLKAGLDVIGLQIRIVVEDLSLSRTGGKQREHISHAHTGIPHRWAAMHDLRVHGDPIEQAHTVSLNAHRRNLDAKTRIHHR